MLAKHEHDLLYGQQIKQLYALAPVGIIASLVNGSILTVIQWNVISHGLLLTWFASLVLLNGVWALLWYQFSHASRHPQDSHRWGRSFLGGTLASGILWGATGVVLFPESSIPHQIFLAFVLGGMIAGATAVYAALQGAFLAYALPTITPLLVRFLVLGDKQHMAMGGMCLLFVTMMFVTLRRNHTVTLASMTLNLELGKANQSLQSEIRQREQAEVALRESREQLHSIVQSTDEGIISLNSQGKVMLWNTGAEALFGFSMEEMRGQTLECIIPERFRLAHQQGILRASRAGRKTVEGEMFELMGLRRDGSEFPLELSLGYWHKHGEIFFTGIVRDITARKEAGRALQHRERELEQSQEELRALGAQLISAQEDERRRLSRELHDDMNQRLAMVSLEIDSIQRSLPESDPMQKPLQHLNDQVSALSDSVLHLAYQLHPSILDDLGLVVALQSSIKEFSQWENIAVMFQHRDVPQLLPQDIASCVYRVTQECLRNVAKHAQASQVSVEVRGVEGGLQLVITDNGIGFIPESGLRGTRGLGLIGMKERIRVVRGTFEVKASQGKGTTVTAWIPLSTTS
ncbi:sensor histidine kinase [Candidatus Nitrospira allomarina]|uniref:Oxygen sensor histidine kinase NreB n=1 Tax=Candidatus Nitrospira allomarina TaxID=3020900 RepID=A0AA96GF99_9BACT|nr:PAS domain S-box protein [Candidatus Nitrospira allomarina]WNM60067.1 PAS domain S-box protein [Candidatus Nitrospira allomarina]